MMKSKKSSQMIHGESLIGPTERSIHCKREEKCQRWHLAKCYQEQEGLNIRSSKIFIKREDSVF